MLGLKENSLEAIPKGMLVRDPESTEAVSERLRLLREVMGYSTQLAFADFLKVAPKRWQNLENEYPLSKEVAMIIVRRIPGVSLDWLYRGRQEGLSAAMLHKLADLPAGPGKATTAP